MNDPTSLARRQCFRGFRSGLIGLGLVGGTWLFLRRGADWFTPGSHAPPIIANLLMWGVIVFATGALAYGLLGLYGLRGTGRQAARDRLLGGLALFLGLLPFFMALVTLVRKLQ